MKRPRHIVLLTDFGLSDPYVGIMKGVIAIVNPRLRIIDLTHNIPSQDIQTASFVLANSVDYFPKNTVYIVVVDPGVGTARKAIAVETARGFFVAPDNGVLSEVLLQYSPKRAVELTDSKFWHTKNPSKTFHGRDIFAPCGAHLANGLNFQKLGSPLDLPTLNRIESEQPIEINGVIHGLIQAVDHFGNLITNIPATMLSDKSWLVKTPEIDFISALAYADLPNTAPLSLIGSHDFVELALRNESAAAKTALKPGTPISLHFIENKGVK